MRFFNFFFGGGWVEQILLRGAESGAIIGFAVGKDRVEMFHLQFADDTIVFVLHEHRLLVKWL